MYYASLFPRYVSSKSFRDFIGRWNTGANTALFQKEIFEHYRIVFEKIAD